MSNKSLTSNSESITIRCPKDLADSIKQQMEDTGDKKTNVIIQMLSSSIPSVSIIERTKLPDKSGIYFVYTTSHELLYIGKADNLKKRWNSHHKYQSFMEASVDSRIGYFVVDDIARLDFIIEEFIQEPTETTNCSFVTSDKLELVTKKLASLEAHYQTISTVMAKLGVDDLEKKLELALPPRGLQEWSPEAEEKLYGIIPSALIKKVGFGSTLEFEKALKILELEEITYLSELSGWYCQEIKNTTSSKKSSRRYYSPQWSKLYKPISDLPRDTVSFDFSTQEKAEGLTVEELCQKLGIKEEDASLFAKVHGDVDLSDYLYLLSRWKLSQIENSPNRYYPAENEGTQRKEILQKVEKIKRKMFGKKSSGTSE